MMQSDVINQFLAGRFAESLSCRRRGGTVLCVFTHLIFGYFVLGGYFVPVSLYIFTVLHFKMPKGGKKGGHKGRMRTFNHPEEIDAQMKAEKERKKEEEAGAALNDAAEEKLPGSGSEDSDDEDGSQKRKGVEGLIDIENPNRVAQKNKKVTDIQLEEPRSLSRREREEIEKQKAKERYMKMHLAGHTDQAKADLARLAIVRKQREDAARKKEEERKAKEAASTSSRGVSALSLNK
ncbi:hypothetical protein DPEC_G00274580 [Dallia pectoralis]|uniref:Uncharacterized protein n=1 Tax=Dallia pectoralis TaxID=75939 RepID=A0ACC2FL30_DALPE|nr:hypothetical protein DPEC_G00274580 [Dallia pectoralis]